MLRFFGIFSVFSDLYYVFLASLISGLGCDFLYVGGQSFARFGAFFNSFIFCYREIAFGNL
jgi:hypothetical protein